MGLSTKDVKHIAKLSRLHIEEKELEDYREKLESILGYVEKLSEVNLDDVPELQHALDVVNVFRVDEIEECEADVRERILDNFTHRNADLLEVQAVFDRS